MNSDAAKAANAKLVILIDTQQREWSRLPISERSQSQEEFQKTLERTRAELYGLILRTAKSELEKLTAENHYDVVFELSGDTKVQYYNPKIDVTGELTRRIDRALNARR
jgi:Skp family chaperone for outer membrane proteins